jgi:teichuronic acid biosynthesis glycosyltransferase TuaC
MFAAEPSSRALVAPGVDRLLRIALVTPMLPVPHDQTRGRYIHETARSLSKLATVRVYFQTARYPRLPGFSPRSYKYGQVRADYQLAGVDVEAFDYPAVPFLSRSLNATVSSRILAPRVRPFLPDLMLAYWVYPDGGAALRVARELGVPCVIGALGSDIHVRSGLSVALTRSTIAKADALLTVSAAMRNAAIADFGARPDRVHTVVNGYNTSIFGLADRDEARRSLGVEPSDRLIIYVGRFVEAKGIKELLEAFQRLVPGNPTLRLGMIGDGVWDTQLRHWVRNAGLSDRVFLPGGLPPERVARWICASDVLTLPSWSEGYPNVLVEALACGRPVVATDVGGAREIVTDRNGILVPARDVDALCQGLKQALAAEWDPSEIARGMQRSWDDVAAETLSVCRAVLAAPRARAHIRV